MLRAVRCTKFQQRRRHERTTLCSCTKHEPLAIINLIKRTRQASCSQSCYWLRSRPGKVATSMTLHAVGRSCNWHTRLRNATAVQGQPVVLNNTWQYLVACLAHICYTSSVGKRSYRAVTPSTWRLGSKGHTSWQCPRPCPSTSPQARRASRASQVRIRKLPGESHWPTSEPYRILLNSFHKRTFLAACTCLARTWQAAAVADPASQCGSSRRCWRPPGP